MPIPPIQSATVEPAERRSERLAIHVRTGIFSTYTHGESHGHDSETWVLTDASESMYRHQCHVLMLKA